MSVVPVTGPEKSLWCFPRLILFTFSLFATVSLLCQHPPFYPARTLSFIHSAALLVLNIRRKKKFELYFVSPSFYKPPSPPLPPPSLPLMLLLSPWLCLSVCLPLRPRSFPIIPTYCLLSFSSVTPSLFPSVLPLPVAPPSSHPPFFTHPLSLIPLCVPHMHRWTHAPKLPSLFKRIWSLELFDMALHCSYLIISSFVRQQQHSWFPEKRPHTHYGKLGVTRSQFSC